MNKVELEAKELTSRNLAIAQKYVDSVSDIATGILLSGSNAWGADYAVTELSDIDLLVVADDLSSLQRIVKIYCDKKLCNSRELERTNLFCKLYEKEEAEQLSMITEFSGVPVSIDFLLHDSVEEICSLAPMRGQIIDGITLRIILEFRTNRPKEDGYSLDDLSGLKNTIYHPHFINVNLGYLSETLVDGIAVTNDNYFMGVMSFFLSVDPVVLIDRDKRLSLAVNELQRNITSLLGGNAPAYITRQDRMSDEALEQAKKAFVDLI